MKWYILQNLIILQFFRNLKLTLQMTLTLTQVKISIGLQAELYILHKPFSFTSFNCFTRSLSINYMNLLWQWPERQMFNRTCNNINYMNLLLQSVLYGVITNIKDTNLSPKSYEPFYSNHTNIIYKWHVFYRTFNS